MAKIERIDVTLNTSKVPDAETNGQVYLFVGGREFNLKQPPPHDDRARGAEDTYHLGKEGNVENPKRNDPRTPFPLTTEDVDKLPVWLRFEPEDREDEWNLERAAVRVTGLGGEFGDPVTRTYRILDQATDNVWLGRQSGLYIYLKKISS